MKESKMLFCRAAPMLHLTSCTHPNEAIRDAIAEVEKAYAHAALDLVQLKGLERVFVEQVNAFNSQHSMPPKRKQELAWRQVTKEECYEKMKLLLPALTYVEGEEWEAPRPRGLVM